MDQPGSGLLDTFTMVTNPHVAVEEKVTVHAASLQASEANNCESAQHHHTKLQPLLELVPWGLPLAGLR